MRPNEIRQQKRSMRREEMDAFTLANIVAFTAILLLAVIYMMISRSLNLAQIILGADGRPSTSKLQFLLWTVAILFSYVALYATRVSKNHFEAISEIPLSL